VLTPRNLRDPDYAGQRTGREGATKRIHVSAGIAAAFVCPVIPHPTIPPSLLQRADQVIEQ
jgi:hypothetical protein